MKIFDLIKTCKTENIVMTIFPSREWVTVRLADVNNMAGEREVARTISIPWDKHVGMGEDTFLAQLSSAIIEIRESRVQK